VARGTADPYLFYKRATPLWIAGRTEEAAADYEEFAGSRVPRRWPMRGCSSSGTTSPGGSRAGRDGGCRSTARKGAPGAAGCSGARQAGTWLERVLACLAGEIAPENLAASANPAVPGQTCEGFYYAAERASWRGGPTRRGGGTRRASPPIWCSIRTSSPGPHERIPSAAMASPRARRGVESRIWTRDGGETWSRVRIRALTCR